jgi:FMN phosphatase YigB (HAD superfamily)
MILLCDLDGTLLSNNMAAFQPPYLKALGTYLSYKIPPDKLVAELLTGTRMMLENENPLMTLESAFDQHFYPSLGFEKLEISDLLLAFYQREFPSLGNITRQLPEAIEFVTSRLSSGDRFVVATNPLFPRAATFARLVWAGLPVDRTKFELVTTYEFMHFSKPHATYYAEILAYLGYPDEPVLMIGNDLNDDILPAQKLGIPGFWLTLSDPIQGNNGVYHPSGTYQSLTEFLATDFQPVDIYRTISLSASLSILKATLAALHTYSYYVGFSEVHTRNQLQSLISDRLIIEKRLIENSNVNDKPTIKADPTCVKPPSMLISFVRYRLEWMQQFASLHNDNNSSPESEAYSLLQSSITTDRKFMMECAQWFTDTPKFTNLPDKTPS